MDLLDEADARDKTASWRVARAFNGEAGEASRGPVDAVGMAAGVP
jgi:hypothetical protein